MIFVIILRLPEKWCVGALFERGAPAETKKNIEHLHRGLRQVKNKRKMFFFYDHNASVLLVLLSPSVCEATKAVVRGGYRHF